MPSSTSFAKEETLIAVSYPLAKHLEEIVERGNTLKLGVLREMEKSMIWIISTNWIINLWSIESWLCRRSAIDNCYGLYVEEWKIFKNISTLLGSAHTSWKHDVFVIFFNLLVECELKKKIQNGTSLMMCFRNLYLQIPVD